MRVSARLRVVLTLAAHQLGCDGAPSPTLASNWPPVIPPLGHRAPVSILLGPSLTAPSQDSVWVWWHIDSEVSSHTVEFGLSASLGQMKALHALTREPYVELTQLLPGRVYFYRVSSDQTKSPVFQFKTPEEQGPFRMVLWADNQNGVDLFSRCTVPTILRANPLVMIGAGDLVQHGEVYSRWSSELYGPGGEIFRSIPWFPSRGNHDGESELAQRMLPLPDGGSFYARSYGPLRVTILDSNLKWTHDAPQLRWFRSETKRPEWKNASFRVVALHHPPFTRLWDAPTYDGEPAQRALLVPQLEQSGADLVISGHTHAYERGARRRAIGGLTTYLVVGGAGGVLDTVSVFPWPHIEKSVPRHHVVTVDVTPEALKLEALDTCTREVFDRFEIRRQFHGEIRGTPL